MPGEYQIMTAFTRLGSKENSKGIAKCNPDSHPTFFMNFMRRMDVN